MKLDWNARSLQNGTHILTTIDAHAAGEPLRVITSGLPELPGKTILERRRNMQSQFDDIRQALMWEPRGHHEMYGAIVTEPVTPEADIGVIFLHNEGYSTMCGHGVIALVTVLIESGALSVQGALTRRNTPVNLDTPAGLVRATAHLDASGHVEAVSFLNVPSFLYTRDLEVAIPGIGPVTLDIAFGGAFYAILPSAQVGLRVTPEQTAQLVQQGEAIKRAVNESIAIKHPQEPDLGFLYGTIFTDTPQNPAHHSRNICIFANAEVDRSPTGTGVSARLALHHAKGEIREDEQITIESILGAESCFSGRVVERSQIGSYAAIVPEVSGRAFITGRHEFLLDPRDTLGRGFLL